MRLMSLYGCEKVEKNILVLSFIHISKTVHVTFLRETRILIILIR